jgi:hypothetical protein
MADERYDQEMRRASNEGRRHFFGTTSPVIAFVCECDRDACFETAKLSAAEYDAIRPGPILAPSHRPLVASAGSDR